MKKLSLFAFIIISIFLDLPVLKAEEEGKAPTKILFLGDSLTAGYGLSKEEAYPALVKEKGKLAGLELDCINAGVSGDTTAGGLRRVSWLLRQPLDLVFIALGGNDGLRGILPKQTQSNLEQIVTAIHKKQPKAKIVLAGMQMPDNMGADYQKSFQAVFPAVQKKTKVHLLPFLLEGVAADVKLNQEDRIHPNAKGQKIMADTVWKSLQPLLKPKKGKDDLPSKLSLL